MAVAYKDGSLFALDLRGPNIILRLTDRRPKKRHSIGLPSRHHADASVDSVGSMAWTVSGVEKGKALMYVYLCHLPRGPTKMQDYQSDWWQIDILE